MKNIVSKLSGWGIWLLLGMLTLAVIKDFARANQIKSQIAAEKNKIAKIEAENKKLEEQIALAQSPEFIEKEVRNKLGLGKPNEAMVVLPDEELVRKLAPVVPKDEDTLPDPNWKKWVQLFISK